MKEQGSFQVLEWTIGKDMSDQDLEASVEAQVEHYAPENYVGHFDASAVVSALRKISKCESENDLHFLRVAVGGDRISQAMYGLLPEGFTEWDLANNTGWTVAHEAAEYGTLPEDFDQWDLADESGWTVAHEAAKYGTLPDDFDYSRWESLVTQDGETVLDIAKIHGHAPKAIPRMDG